MEDFIKEEKKKTFTQNEVTKLLDKQIKDCSDSIDKGNMSQYTAKKKVSETARVKI